MSKHTPGPWKFEWRREHDECLIGRADEMPFCMAGIIAKGRGFANDEVEANARLIAAAPEMLEALKKAYQQCIEFLNEGDFHRHIEWDAGYIVDAIAKAEGRKE